MLGFGWVGLGRGDGGRGYIWGGGEWRGVQHCI